MSLINRMLLPVVCSAVIFACPPASTGHEVDQYSVPAGDWLLDLNGYWNDLLYDAVSRAVEKANRDIAAQKKSWIPDVGGLRRARQKSPETLTRYVRNEFPTALKLIEALEANLEATNFRDLGSGRRIAYRAAAEDSVYQEGPQIPDMRHWNKLFFMRCSTIKIHGTYLGTDKLGHFVAMGYHYYNAYRASRLIGQSDEQALKSAIAICGSVTENSFLGISSTGIFSNADMATNYMGLKFYWNVTQPVKLKGQWVPPMAVREGDYWKLNDHFTRNGPLMAMYVSVHWDEVLNPNHFDASIRAKTELAIKRRCRDLLDWYAGNDPRRRNPQYFHNILQHCTTYYGEEYGHSGDTKQLFSLATACFDETPPSKTIVRGNRSTHVWPRATPHRVSGNDWNASRTSSLPFRIWRNDTARR